MIKRLALLFFVFLCYSYFAFSQNYLIKENISYISSKENDSYKKERCKLDIYYPSDIKDYPTVVWFHGGGLEEGGKFIPEELKQKKVAVVAVNYRLSPKATNPAYIEDAAEAVAWVFNNISSFGGSVNDIYVAGHSAGGYLTIMVGLDKSYLAKYGIDANRIKGLMPISGQTNTHYTIKKERGLPMAIPYIDKYAPISHARKDAPQILLISGDRHLELPARYEENAHLYAILKTIEHKDVQLFELEGFNHGNVCSPGLLLTIDLINRNKEKKKN